ncbi:ATP-binding protein [Nocardia sp. NPDC024068]|uniref:ATP-binding protein n=1 Tax=Nocardia sp. NPDC024068 TaxID=3157197 RepID=UPI0033E7625F
MTRSRPPGLHSPPRRTALEFPARPEQLVRVRHAVKDWLSGLPLDERRAYDVLLAVGEACANAVEHGHRGDGGTIRLCCAAGTSGLRITVTDHGSWKTPDHRPDTARGRGMAIIRALIPDVEVVCSSHGTIVDMRMPLAEPGDLPVD